MVERKRVNLTEIKVNESNPRFIKDDDFKALVKSLKEIPEMADVREIVVNKDMVILGGNMRYRAMLEAGWTECNIAIVDWAEDKQREFIIKDNVSRGDWDYSLLANEWDLDLLKNWGIELGATSFDNIENEFESPDSVDTKHTCPSCGYEW